MKETSNRNVRIGILIGRIIFIGAIVGSLMISIKLFAEDRSYSGSGWVIIAALFIFMFLLSILPVSKNLASSENNPQPPHYSKPEGDEDMLLLLATQDPIQLNRITSALESNKIQYSILDQHSTSMMSFLPDVEQRIMVLNTDLGAGLRILEEMER